MERSGRITAPADERSLLTLAADPTLLAGLARRWTTPSSMPIGAARLWERSMASFRSGAFAYENFTEAVRLGFETVDAALRTHISDLVPTAKVLTFGRLIGTANTNGRLTPRQYEWLCYALRFRNRLNHADGRQPLLLSPGAAQSMLEGTASFLGDLLQPLTGPGRETAQPGRRDQDGLFRYPG